MKKTLTASEIIRNEARVTALKASMKFVAEGDLKTRLNNAIEDAELAFWAEIANAFPEAEMGDFAPDQAFAWGHAMNEAVAGWVDNNTELITQEFGDGPRREIYDKLRGSKIKADEDELVSVNDPNDHYALADNIQKNLAIYLDVKAEGGTQNKGLQALIDAWKDMQRIVQPFEEDFGKLGMESSKKIKATIGEKGMISIEDIDTRLDQSMEWYQTQKMGADDSSDSYTHYNGVLVGLSLAKSVLREDANFQLEDLDASKKIKADGVDDMPVSDDEFLDVLGRIQTFRDAADNVFVGYEAAIPPLGKAMAEAYPNTGEMAGEGMKRLGQVVNDSHEWLDNMKAMYRDIVGSLVRSAKMTKKGQKAVSKDIKKYKGHGKPQKQAVAIALSKADKAGYKGAKKVKGSFAEFQQLLAAHTGLKASDAGVASENTFNVRVARIGNKRWITAFMVRHKISDLASKLLADYNPSTGEYQEEVVEPGVAIRLGGGPPSRIRLLTQDGEDFGAFQSGDAKAISVSQIVNSIISPYFEPKGHGLWEMEEGGAAMDGHDSEMEFWADVEKEIMEALKKAGHEVESEGAGNEDWIYVDVPGAAGVSAKAKK